MDKLALARINTLPSHVMQDDFVPTSEQLITLTYGQLQDLITQAVQKAIQPLQDEVRDLKATVARQDKEIIVLRAQVCTMEGIEEQDVTRVCLDIAQDRQRISKLEKSSEPQPQPMQKDRAEILRALLATNGGKMLAKDARHKMHLRKDLFSQLLRTCDFIEIKPFHVDKRKSVIILKSELV